MTLYINCCVREESRTDRLARAVLQKLGGDFTELKLYEENLKPLDRETLNKRTALIEQGDYSDQMFDYAKQFANADKIVIAAPYWDLSFPATLKTYIESSELFDVEQVSRQRWSVTPKRKPIEPPPSLELNSYESTN